MDGSYAHPFSPSSDQFAPLVSKPRFKRRQSRRLNESCANNRNAVTSPTKKRRGEASDGEEEEAEVAHRAKIAKASQPAPGLKIHGPALDQLILLVQHACSVYTALPLGTPVWAKLGGFCAWPGIVWSLAHCRKMEAPDVIMSFQPGCCLVHFFGEHSNAWLNTDDVIPMQLGTELHKSRLSGMLAWGRKANKSDLVTATLAELEGACASPDAEVARVKRMTEVIFGMKFASSQLCSLCRQEGAQLHCCHCQRSFHPLCLKPPALSMQHMPKPAPWACPCCQEDNYLKRKGGDGVDDGEEAIEQARMGLTPDWIIHEAAFQVFGLPEPTPDQPFIKGLLDPCTNSKIAPNIPAEVLYDRRDDGLKLENSWAGNHIILNPPYKSQIQWRFINRAIDGVENRTIPGVVLLTRNSTDTAYYQRLRPYPRVLLRRGVVIFKDYERTPIGFGVAVFLIARADCTDMYARFYEAFSEWGEASIPIDKTFMQSLEFPLLLERLRLYAEQHHRDHWVQCNKCRKWRMVPYAAICHIKDKEWSCDLLKPPDSTCDMPLTKYEACGIRYATSGKGDIWWELQGRRRHLQYARAAAAGALQLDPAAAAAGMASLLIQPEPQAFPPPLGEPSPVATSAAEAVTVLHLGADGETASGGSCREAAGTDGPMAQSGPGDTAGPWSCDAPAPKDSGCLSHFAALEPGGSFFLDPFGQHDGEVQLGGCDLRAGADLAALLHPELIDASMDYFARRRSSSGAGDVLWRHVSDEEEHAEGSQGQGGGLGGACSWHRSGGPADQSGSGRLQLCPVPAGDALEDKMLADQLLSSQVGVLPQRAMPEQMRAECPAPAPVPGSDAMLSGGNSLLYAGLTMQEPALRLAAQGPAEEVQVEQGEQLQQERVQLEPLLGQCSTGPDEQLQQQHDAPQPEPLQDQCSLVLDQLLHQHDAEHSQPQQGRCSSSADEAMLQQDPQQHELAQGQSGLGPHEPLLQQEDPRPHEPPGAPQSHGPEPGHDAQIARRPTVNPLDLARQARMLATRACIANSQLGAGPGSQGQLGLPPGTQAPAESAHPFLVHAGGLVAGHAEADRARRRFMAAQEQLQQEMRAHQARLHQLQLEEADSRQQLAAAMAKLEQMHPPPLEQQAFSITLDAGTLPEQHAAIGPFEDPEVCAWQQALECVGQQAAMDVGAGHQPGSMVDPAVGADAELGSQADQALRSSIECTSTLQLVLPAPECEELLTPQGAPGSRQIEVEGQAGVEHGAGAGVEPAAWAGYVWPAGVRHGRAARSKLSPAGLSDRTAFIADSHGAWEEEEASGSASLPESTEGTAPLLEPALCSPVSSALSAPLQPGANGGLMSAASLPGPSQDAQASITLPLASLESALQTLLASRLAAQQQQPQAQGNRKQQQQPGQHRVVLQL